jgi:hypothetical protein
VSESPKKQKTTNFVIKGTKGASGKRSVVTKQSELSLRETRSTHARGPRLKEGIKGSPRELIASLSINSAETRGPQAFLNFIVRMYVLTLKLHRKDVCAYSQTWSHEGISVVLVVATIHIMLTCSWAHEALKINPLNTRSIVPPC